MMFWSSFDPTNLVFPSHRLPLSINGAFRTSCLWASASPTERGWRARGCWCFRVTVGPWKGYLPIFEGYLPTTQKDEASGAVWGAHAPSPPPSPSPFFQEARCHLKCDAPELNRLHCFSHGQPCCKTSSSPLCLCPCTTPSMLNSPYDQHSDPAFDTTSTHGFLFSLSLSLYTHHFPSCILAVFHCMGIHASLPS